MLKALLLILLGNNLIFSFSFLLDNFTDPNSLKKHLITKGSDLVGKLQRSINPYSPWSFLSDGGISFSNQSNASLLTYAFEDSMKLSDFDKVKFNFSQVPLNNYHELIFWSPNTTYCRAYFKFESPDNEQIIDLNKIKQEGELFSYKSNDLSFDENNITEMGILFNSSRHQGGQPNDCILDSIEVVPEPFSIITLGSGLMKLVQRKGRKKEYII